MLSRVTIFSGVTGEYADNLHVLEAFLRRHATIRTYYITHLNKSQAASNIKLAVTDWHVELLLSPSSVKWFP